MVATIKQIGLVGLVFVISGCSMFSPVQTGATTTYVLNTLPQTTVKSAKSHLTLRVTPPVSSAVYDTDAMAYSIHPYQVSYFAKNSWADKPTRMLQPLIVQTLQNTRYFHAIVSSPSLGRNDFTLNTQLLQLQQDFYQGRSVVRLILRAELVRGTNGCVIAAKQFSATEVAPQNNPYGGVVAANRATASVLQQLAKFCLQKL